MKKHKPDSLKIGPLLPKSWSMCGRMLLEYDAEHAWTQKWTKVTCKLCLLYRPRKKK